MTTNSIAISRNLVAAGLELTAANAIAEEMVTNVDDTLATKEGLVKVETTTKENFIRVEEEVKTLATKVDLKDMESRLESKMGKMDTKIEVIETKINVVIALMIGLFIVFIADILMR